MTVPRVLVRVYPVLEAAAFNELFEGGADELLSVIAARQIQSAAQQRPHFAAQQDLLLIGYPIRIGLRGLPNLVW